jgi:hypothetical protein
MRGFETMRPSFLVRAVADLVLVRRMSRTAVTIALFTLTSVTAALAESYDGLTIGRETMFRGRILAVHYGPRRLFALSFPNGYMCEILTLKKSLHISRFENKEVEISGTLLRLGGASFVILFADQIRVIHTSPTPNQSLQPTAGWRETLRMKPSALEFAAELAPASRG